MVGDVAWLELESCPAGPRKELDAHDRVAAEREEVVVDGHPLDAEELRPEPGQGSLVIGSGGNARRSTLARRARLGQRTRVDLAVRQSGEGQHRDDGARHHELRESLFEGRANVGGAVDGRRGHVGHQLGPARYRFAAEHGCLDDAGKLHEGRLDLARLDAMAPDLELGIGPTQIEQRTVGSMAREIAGSVEPFHNAAQNLDVDEGRLREIGATEIPGRHALASEVQLAGEADRYRSGLRVEHMGSGVDDRPTDGHRTSGIGGFDAVHGRPDRRLGRPVLVVELGGREQVVVDGSRRCRARLACNDGDLERGESVPTVVEQERVQRRQCQQMGDRVLLDQLGEDLHLLFLSWSGEDEGATCAQRPEDADRRAVERERRQQQEPLGPSAVVMAPGGGGVHEITVGHRHALRSTRRARRVDHVGGSTAGPLDARRVRHRWGQVRGGDHDVQAGVVDDRLIPGIGIGGIERNVGGARLQDTQNADEHLRRSFDLHPHPGAGLDAIGQQLSSKTVGPSIELGVGDLPCRRDDRRVVGSPGGGLLDQIVDASARGERHHGVVPRPESFGVGRPEQREAVQRLLDGLDELYDRRGKGIGDRGDPGLVEAGTVVDEGESKPLTGKGEERERIIAVLVEFEIGEGDASDARPVDGGDRVVLEHQDAVEQRLPGVDVAPSLYVGQRGCVVVLESKSTSLQLSKPVAHVRIGVEPCSERHGVDEHADRVLDPRQRRRSARHGDPEHHVVRSRPAAQHQGPSALDNGVEGESSGCAEAPSSVGDVSIELAIELATSATGGDRWCRRVDRCRGREFCELGGPCLLRRDRLAAGQPLYVVAKRHWFREACVIEVVCGMDRHGLVEQKSRRPSVDDQVMEREYQP